MKQKKRMIQRLHLALTTSTSIHEYVVMTFAIHGGLIRRATVLIVLSVLFCAGVAFSADKKIISPPGTKSGGNYSQGILIDGTLYISGQAGEDAVGQIPNDFEAEVNQAFENIRAVLKAAGMSPTDVVSVQVYLTDSAKFQRMNTVYREFFKEPRPTRTTVVIARLVGAGNIEITVTARK